MSDVPGGERNLAGVLVAGLSVLSSGMQQIFCRSMQQKHGLASHELLANTAPAQARRAPPCPGGPGCPSVSPGAARACLPALSSPSPCRSSCWTGGRECSQAGHRTRMGLLRGFTHVRTRRNMHCLMGPGAPQNTP